MRLNAPYGARCFLTLAAKFITDAFVGVLMHLMVRGAF